jgi:hypothetical protein
MRVIDIRPTDVEITMVFSLTEAKNIKEVLDKVIIRRDMFSDEEIDSYDMLKEFIDSITKTDDE